MRVLLVEDDEMIGRSLMHALEGAGWSVDWVRDGQLAQSALADGGYTCVLLDLGLPKQDGTEVLRRARDRGDATPVLVLTARDGLDDRIHGARPGRRRLPAQALRTAANCSRACAPWCAAATAPRIR